MKFNLIYITAGNLDDAKKIGRELVLERLVACVNILSNMNSIYWWDGKVQEDNEVVIIAKTKESLAPEVIKKVKSIHSYSCPCIVSLPIENGHKDYLEWIARETR